jgi:hypothetical protein
MFFFFGTGFQRLGENASCDCGRALADREALLWLNEHSFDQCYFNPEKLGINAFLDGQ